MLNLQAKYTTGKCTKCQELGCKSCENIVYNNDNGRVRSRDMSVGRLRAVHVSSPSHVTVSKILCSGYTCLIFRQNIRLESALNAENVTVSLPRISFINTTKASFVVATCDQRFDSVLSSGRSGAKWVNPYLTGKSSESSTVGPRQPWLDLGSRTRRFGEL